MYCCTDFEIIVEKTKGFVKKEGMWIMPGDRVFSKISFCPFCGSNLRFMIEKTTGSVLFDWRVSDRGKIVAYFEDRKAAEKHVRSL